MLLVAILAFTSFAQEHMTFKGIELNGTASAMAKKLEGQGFSKYEALKDVEVLSGKFTGQDVFLGIYSTPVSKVVCRVAVIYVNCMLADSWMVLSDQYESLKEMLTKKYGSPDEVIEEFKSPYSVQNSPLQAFKFEKATYKTRYKTENGGITLSISGFKSYITVILLYWDKQNEDLMEAELESDL